MIVLCTRRDVQRVYVRRRIVLTRVILTLARDVDVSRLVRRTGSTSESDGAQVSLLARVFRRKFPRIHRQRLRTCPDLVAAKVTVLTYNR